MKTRGQHYTAFKTALGWVGLLGSDSGLLAATLPQPSASEAARRLGERIKDAVTDEKALGDTVERLKAYFSGERVDFPEKLDLSPATDFQRRVWRLARLIPYGETRSYGWLAAKLGKSGTARAVGQALGRNPLPVIIPCHRVVAAGNRIGGFSGGVGVKKALLTLETANTESVSR